MPTPNQKPCLILLFPEQKDDVAVLEAAVRSTANCEVEVIETAPALLKRAANGDVSGLVASVKRFDTSLLKILTKAQEMSPEMLSVVVADETEERTKKQLNSAEGIVTIDKPATIQGMALICEKIIQRKGIASRKYQRFPTDQKAVIETLDSNKQYQARVLNISKGGAYLEITSGQTVTVKDVVKITIQLKDLHKDHVMHGKVTWVVPVGLNGFGFGFGVEFVNSNQAYLSLLEKI